MAVLYDHAQLALPVVGSMQGPEAVAAVCPVGVEDRELDTVVSTRRSSLNLGPVVSARKVRSCASPRLPSASASPRLLQVSRPPPSPAQPARIGRGVADPATSAHAPGGSHRPPARRGATCRGSRSSEQRSRRCSIRPSHHESPHRFDRLERKVLKPAVRRAARMDAVQCRAHDPREVPGDARASCAAARAGRLSEDEVR